MTYLYYAIVSFGVLLLLYTVRGWFTTKRKINQYDASESKMAAFIKMLKAKSTLWGYYFIAGDKKKLIKKYHYK